MPLLESIYNVVRDPSFESGVDYWDEIGTVDNIQFTTNGTTHSGLHACRLDHMHGTLVGGPSGIEQQLGILDEGTWKVGIWLYCDMDDLGGDFPIHVRAGRADTGTPGIIATFHTDVTPYRTWAFFSGNMVADGIHPYKIQIISDVVTGASLTFIVDDVSVLPELTPFHSDTYQQLLPVADQDEALGFPLRNYLGASAAMFDQIEFYARDRIGRPGWTIATDPNTCPDEALDWLAQVAGVELQNGISAAAKRDAIIKAEGRERGTRRLIAREVAKLLTGTKTVGLYERTPDDNHFSIGVLRSEVANTEYSWYDWLDANPLSGSAIAIADADFETGTGSGWSTSTASPFVAGGAVKSISPENGFTGTKSLRVFTSAVNQGVRISLGTPTAGQRIIGAFVKGTAGQTVNINLEYNSTQQLSTQKIIMEDTWTPIFFPAFALPNFNGTNTAFLSFTTSGSFVPHQVAAIWYLDTVFMFPAAVGYPTQTGLTNDIWLAGERKRNVEVRQFRPVFFNAGWHYDILAAAYRTSTVGGEELFFNTYASIASNYATFQDLLDNNPI